MGKISKDYGPDNVSTPEDIAETNELESLRQMREDIQKILSKMNLQRSLWNLDQVDSFYYLRLMAINRVVNPNE